jgi:hypothetical protein
MLRKASLGMNNLLQIESVVAALPKQDQRSLLSWLQDLLHRGNPEQSHRGARAQERRAWLAELAELRSQTHTGKQGMPLQQMMDELREERC